MACSRLVPRRRVGKWRVGKRGGVSQPSVPLQVPLCWETDGWQAEIRAVDVNCVVVTINYRHAPEHVFPAAHDDALAAWRWVTNPATTGLPELDLGRVAIGGLSAYLPRTTSTILECFAANKTHNTEEATSPYPPPYAPPRTPPSQSFNFLCAPSSTTPPRPPPPGTHHKTRHS